jgi:hypothetical protein
MLGSCAVSRSRRRTRKHAKRAERFSGRFNQHAQCNLANPERRAEQPQCYVADSERRRNSAGRQHRNPNFALKRSERFAQQPKCVTDDAECLAEHRDDA